MRTHDRPTRGHAERVLMLTDLVAEAMNVPARDRDLLRWSAILHDIGKLRVSPAILNKPGKPTEAEWALLRAHPMHGAQIAGGLLPWLGEWGDVIVQHHERYDGTGYPAGLAGRDISLDGRIVAVADAYEVMAAARSYRRPVSRVAAHRELVKWSGRQFDPAVVRAMVSLSAPRLRRAQGLLAWLSDIPMVATGYVPAATVARVVGVGALATGAATGAVLPATVVTAAEVPAHSQRAADRSVDRPVHAGRPAATDPVTTAASRPSAQARKAGAKNGQTPVKVKKVHPVADGGSPLAKVPTPEKSPSPAPDYSGSDNSGSGSSGNSGSGSSGSGSSGNSGSGSSGSGSSGNSGSGSSGSGSSGNSGSGHGDSDDMTGVVTD